MISKLLLNKMLGKKIGGYKDKLPAEVLLRDRGPAGVIPAGREVY